MKKFNRTNTLIGWIVFLAASFVYLSTIEPSASFWDCSEFIASTFKLEVGHPPGAPFFMLISRLFTLFAGHNVANVAKMVNSWSALASGLTIMFMFWTIVHLVKKIIIKDQEQLTIANQILIFGSAIIGAFTYTFSDTFWFSAVEGEVYASSSLFTAVVFWAILKWENVADKPYSNRWIILIAYLMGLSIGVHLLNLLAIPAIVLVYYFKKYEVNRKGVILALLVALLLLGSIMYVIIPGVVKLAEVFERLFVNGFHLPYNTGLIFYGLLLIGSIIWSLVYTYRNKKILANTIILAITMILIGYSSYAGLVIRSHADPPMDENDPENIFNLLSYLNREQYGDRPLIYGQYFNAPIKKYAEGKPTYKAEDGRYKIVYRKPKYVYDNSYMTIFPRMYSNDPQHINMYIEWAKLKKSDLFEARIDANGNAVRDRDGNVVYDYSKPKAKPTFIQNLRFFFRYQLNYMYIRYFMWNFAGRQNDIQGQSKYDITKGNWLSGIKFIDQARLGNQDKIPSMLKNNRARNIYYMIPLLLGLLGMYYHYKRHRKSFWVVLALFIMTGLAIVVYLNQTPLQPRDRDYAYAGSFYAFAIWVGLGVMALADAAKNLKWPQLLNNALIGGGISLVVLAFEYMSTKSTGTFLSLLYLGVMAIAVLSLMKILASAIKNDTIIASIAFLLAVPAPFLMGTQNWNDHDRSDRYTARDFGYDYLNSCAPNAILFTNGDNDTFPLWYDQEVEGIRTDVRVVNLSYLGADWYIQQMQRRAYKSAPLPISMTPEQYQEGNRDIVYLIDKIKGYVDLKQAIDFVADDNPETKQLPNVPQKIDYIPAKRFSLPVDSARVISNGTVAPADADKIVHELKWEINRNYITKNHLMVLDMLAYNDWKRPIYYAITVSSDNYLNLENYFQVEGLAYRIVPIESTGDIYGRGRVDTNIDYDLLINKFKWGGIENPKVYLDENIRRMLSNIRNSFGRLAEVLVDEHKMDSAKVVLDKCMQLMPDNRVPFDIFTLPVIECYYKIGETKKANSIALQLAHNTYENMDYYASLDKSYSDMMDYEKRLGMHVLNELVRMANTYSQDDLKSQFQQKFQEYAVTFNFMVQQ